MSNKTRAILFGIVSVIFFFLAFERYQENAGLLRTGISAVGAICFAIVAIMSATGNGKDKPEG